MFTITVLGTCSGTEPQPNRHHTSFVLQKDEDLYMFDCGENSAYTAYNSGLDLMKMRAVFISHHHIDHTGGLPYLVFVISKMKNKFKLTEKYPGKPLFLPKSEIWEPLCSFCQITQSGNAGNVFKPALIADGEIYKDENISVTAQHNRHLGETGEDGWHSYSFRIECEGKKVVFSGDVKSPDELTPLIGDGCDLLMMENGHHTLEDTCAYSNAQPIKELYLLHLGRTVLADENKAKEDLDRLSVHPAKLGKDGDVLNFR